MKYNGIVEQQHAGGRWIAIETCNHAHRSAAAAEQCAALSIARENRISRNDREDGLSAATNLRPAARIRGRQLCVKSQPTLSADELFGFLFPCERGNEYLAMLFHAYIDDSADRNRERLIVCGAIIGSRTEWGMANGKWKDRLAQDDLEYFKSSHCERLNGQFHKFRDLYGMEEGKRHALMVRDDLYSIICNAPIIALGVTLSVPFHKTMLENPAQFGNVPRVPYRLAFQQVLAESAKAMILLGRNNIVTFGHDDGSDFHVLHAMFKNFKKANPAYAKVMMDFVPLNDKIHPPVQAADCAAWVTFEHATAQQQNPSFQAPTHLRNRTYKIVNWLDRPTSHIALGGDPRDAPAKADYVL